MHAKWQTQRFTLDFPDTSTPLGSVRSALADLTNLPRSAFKLIHAGAVMKDDAAPLSAYNLKPTSTIFLVGQDSVAPSASPSEQATIALIRAELSAVRSQLAPDVRSFLAALHPPTPDPPPSPREHARLGELLLQSLLRLDSIDPARDWLTARTERKAAVKEVQELLDTLDATWAAFSSSNL